jgi:hypothetical protein
LEQIGAPFLFVVHLFSPLHLRRPTDIDELVGSISGLEIGGQPVWVSESLIPMPLEEIKIRTHARRSLTNSYLEL